MHAKTEFFEYSRAMKLDKPFCGGPRACGFEEQVSDGPKSRPASRANHFGTARSGRAQTTVSVWVMVLGLAQCGSPPPSRTTLHSETVVPALSVLDACRMLRTKTFVDLTHAFEPGIPSWPGFPNETRETLYGYREGMGKLGKGFFAQSYTHVGQWGTHVDPPAHFVEGLRTVDQISVSEMILPLVVIDVHDEVARDADYTLAMEDILEWETKHGPVPEGAFVVMRTDWSKRWPDATKMQNKDEKGIAHYPGWGLQALKHLYETRKITASGHETTDTDPGIATSMNDYSLETYVLSTNHYQIELLTNVDQVPEYGAAAIVTFPKPKGGSGFPARVFAVLP